MLGFRFASACKCRLFLLSAAQVDHMTCRKIKVEPVFHMQHCLDMQIPDVSGYEPGQALNVEDLFKVGDMVDVAGTSIGKGFQGACSAVLRTGYMHL